MEKYLSVIVFFVTCMFHQANAQAPKDEVWRLDNPGAQILKGVSVPEGKSYFFTSGLVAPVADEGAGVENPARYGGDTYAQSVAVMKRIAAVLEEASLSLEDVIFLRVYLAPDPQNEGKIDFDAWFKAYPLFFDNPDNPIKVARTTLGVAALARPGILVEIEAVAVRP